jgi:hypothetical protein
MATLTAQPPLIGGGDMSIDIAVGISDSLSSVKGVVKLSVDPVDPLNPIAWGRNDGNVEVTGNKVTVFGTPTDTQYPSALLVASQLALKVNKTVITPGVGTKITYNADGIITLGEFATTADIGETTDKLYVTAGQRAALSTLSGTNTGDQDLSGYALQGSLDATNTTVAGVIATLASYALVVNLDATNAVVASHTANFANYALLSDLAATNVALDAVANDMAENYTPLATHQTLQDNFDALVASMTNPETVEMSAFESKLTFESGLTRVDNTITNDVVTNPVGPNLFLGNGSGSDSLATFSQPAAENLVNGVTGVGQVVLNQSPTITGAILIAPVTALLADDGVSTSPSIFVIDHEFIGGGSIVPGFGTTLEFRARSSNVANRTQGSIRTVWTNATDGSRTSNMVFSPIINGVSVDTLWLHGDGSMALGANIGFGQGLFHAHGGFSTAGVGVQGNVLVDNGTKFVPGKLDAIYLAGQFSSCPITKYTTTDQTGATEQSHFSIPLVAGSTAGTCWKVVAWGDMDQGSSSIQFQSRLRWAGITGPVVASSSVFTTPNQAQTNKNWRLEFFVIITAAGTSGFARGSCSTHDTFTNVGSTTVGVTNTGGNDVPLVNTTINTTMNLTWSMSAITGTPHIRTFGAVAELIARPTPAVT